MDDTTAKVTVWTIAVFIVVASIGASCEARSKDKQADSPPLTTERSD